MTSTAMVQNHRRLLNAISGIVFFGVPHDGMDIDGLKQMLGDRPNRLLVESVSHNNSSVLTRLRRDFAKLLDEFNKIDIFCFYETELSHTPSQA